LHWNDDETRQIAFDLRKKMAEKFPDTKVLQFLEKPEVATQPTMEILLPRKDLTNLLLWISQIRNPRNNVLVHPLSPCNYKDNHDRSIWMGVPVALTEVPLQRFDEALAAKKVPRDRIVKFLAAEKDAKPQFIPELVPAHTGPSTEPWKAPDTTFPDPRQVDESVHDYHLYLVYLEDVPETKQNVDDIHQKLTERFPGKLTRSQQVHKYPNVKPVPSVVEYTLKKEDLGDIALFVAHVAPPAKAVRLPIFLHPVAPNVSLDNHDRAIWIGKKISFGLNVL